MDELPPPPPSSLAPTKSRMETFWYQLSQIHLEEWPLKWRERERERVTSRLNNSIYFWSYLQSMNYLRPNLMLFITWICMIIRSKTKEPSLMFFLLGRLLGHQLYHVFEISNILCLLSQLHWALVVCSHLSVHTVITSVKEVMYLPWAVCLFVLQDVYCCL